jgi:adenine-specific DNA-methyltransferase
MQKKEKKERGVVFTPEWIAEGIVKEVFSGKRLTGKEKILDAGCGEGIFSIVAAREFSRLTGKKIARVIAENIYAIDISEEHIRKTTEHMRKLAGVRKVPDNHLTIGDFCSHSFDERFDFVIGNPPYVRIQHLNERKKYLQKHFSVASSGSIDLYFCFFEQAFRILKKNGRIGFITPNSHFHSQAGSILREMLRSHLRKIINFDYFQVFKDATTYTAITILDKKKREYFWYGENFKENLENIAYKKIQTERMTNKRWEFFDEAFSQRRILLRSKYHSLGEIADIHYGIATLKDDVYIFSPDREDEKFFSFRGFRIEKTLCVPIIKASTYKGIDQKLFLIFPYVKGKLISEKFFISHYPEGWKYINHYRSVLESRDKGGGKYYEHFYAFGRSQGLQTSFGKKIITSSMNRFPRFFVMEDPHKSFYAGYCVKPKRGFSLYEVCDALNSHTMKEYIDAVSKSYRGGYKSYAKSFIKDFVHPKFLRSQLTLL